MRPRFFLPGSDPSPRDHDFQWRSGHRAFPSALARSEADPSRLLVSGLWRCRRERRAAPFKSCGMPRHCCFCGEPVTTSAENAISAPSCRLIRTHNPCRSDRSRAPRGRSCPRAIASIVRREATMRVSRQSPFHLNSRIRGASLTCVESATSTLKVKGSREKNAYFSTPEWSDSSLTLPPRQAQPTLPKDRSISLAQSERQLSEAWQRWS